MSGTAQPGWPAQTVSRKFRYEAGPPTTRVLKAMQLSLTPQAWAGASARAIPTTPRNTAAAHAAARTTILFKAPPSLSAAGVPAPDAALAPNMGSPPADVKHPWTECGGSPPGSPGPPGAGGARSYTTSSPRETVT